MKKIINFIVIDDDSINNTICRINIQRTIPESDIQTFLIPEEGFAYISTQYLTTDNPTILFLDINMPRWSGWDFLDHFEKLDKKIKEQIEIHMLTSSIDANDKKRVTDHKNVDGFIEKPLTKEILQKMFGNTNT
jgi:response regulator RpfG family c-di-GMP phosphodiesterase